MGACAEPKAEVGRPARIPLPLTEAVPRREAALRVIWRWWSVSKLEDEVAEASGRLSSTCGGREAAQWRGARHHAQQLDELGLAQADEAEEVAEDGEHVAVGELAARPQLLQIVRDQLGRRLGAGLRMHGIYTCGCSLDACGCSLGCMGFVVDGAAAAACGRAGARLLRAQSSCCACSWKQARSQYSE